MYSLHIPQYMLVVRYIVINRRLPRVGTTGTVCPAPHTFGHPMFTSVVTSTMHDAFTIDIIPYDLYILIIAYSLSNHWYTPLLSGIINQTIIIFRCAYLASSGSCDTCSYDRLSWNGIKLWQDSEVYITTKEGGLVWLQLKTRWKDECYRNSYIVHCEREICIIWLILQQTPQCHCALRTHVEMMCVIVFQIKYEHNHYCISLIKKMLQWWCRNTF